MKTAQALSGLCLLLGGVACGGRPAEWDSPFDPAVKSATPGEAPSGLQVRGLTGSVAVLDPAQNRVMMLTSPQRLALTSTPLPVGLDVVQFQASVERDKLFVLSRGVTPRFKESDEAPQLRIFDGGTAPEELAKYELQDPYNQLDIDPLGEWLVIRGSEGLVSNPNELVLVKVPKNGGAPGKLRSKTLDSRGGKPVRLQFTSQLSIPGSTPRRLLIVERENDLAVIDLEDLDAPEITVGMPELPGGNGALAQPVEISFHDAIDGEVNPMLALRLKDYSNVVLLTINESTAPEHAFSLDPNQVDVGAPPSQLDFVQTQKDGGLRVAALVPGKQQARLIDPASGAVQTVALNAPFSKIRRITDEVSESSGQDIALLYGDSTNTIAFWRLGATTGTPYRSIDLYDLGIKVAQVFDIPGSEFADRKILSGSSTGSTQQFYVLDLAERKSFPLDVLTNLTLNLSPNGKQLWAFGKQHGFAQLTFDPLQPSSLYTQENIELVHDIATARGETERTAVVLHVLPSHGHSVLAATLFDGLEPSTAQTKFFTNIELMGIKQ